MLALRPGGGGARTDDAGPVSGRGDGTLASLARFDTERPHIDEARRWAAAHEGTPAGDALLLAGVVATIHIGELRCDIRRERIPLLERTRAVAQRLGNYHEEGRILNTLGNTYYFLGKLRQAIPYYEQACSMARELRNRRGEGITLHNLGLVYMDLGEAMRAIDACECGLAITQEICDRRQEGYTLSCLGRVYAALGQPARDQPVR